MSCSLYYRAAVLFIELRIHEGRELNLDWYCCGFFWRGFSDMISQCRFAFFFLFLNSYQKISPKISPNRIQISSELFMRVFQPT